MGERLELEAKLLRTPTDAELAGRNEHYRSRVHAIFTSVVRRYVALDEMLAVGSE